MLLPGLPLLQKQLTFRAIWPFSPLPFDRGDHSFAWKGGGWDAALFFVSGFNIRSSAENWRYACAGSLQYYHASFHPSLLRISDGDPSLRSIYFMVITIKTFNRPNFLSVFHCRKSHS